MPEPPAEGLALAGEVVLGIVILGVCPAHRGWTGRGAPASRPARFAAFGAGLGLAVIGVLRSSEWGWLLPATSAPSVLRMSPIFWLILGGLVMFFFQYMVMMGIFFVIPLYRSVALGLSAIETGIKITPRSGNEPTP